MSGELLSQDEIDALLRGTGESTENENVIHVDDYLTSIEQDALGEIGNISFGSASTALSTLLSQKVEITTPKVSIVEREKLKDEFPHPFVSIQVEFTEGLSGMNLLVIKQSDAAIIADLMLGGNGVNPSELMDEIHISAVQEAMNQMMGSAATSMSTLFSKRVDISPPTVDLVDFSIGEGTENVPTHNLFVKISFRLMIGNLIDSSIMQLLPLDFGKRFVKELMEPEVVEDTSNNNESNGLIEQTLTAERASENQSYQVSNNEQFIEPRYSENTQRSAASDTKQSHREQEKNARNVNVQPAVFSNFEQYPEVAPETKNLNMLLDIPLQVTVELGRTSRSIKEILEMGSGSIIELDKLAGEPVDILVNQQLIAYGEVVVIDENFGVRITDIVSQSDRIKKLK
jgi:flagellar motor switch protein FliN/FliY